MENTVVSPFKAAVKYGLILAAVSILYSLILYSFGLSGNKLMGFLSFIILLVGIIWGIKDFRDNKSGGFISLGKGFSVGIYIGIISAVIGAIYVFVFFKYFDPELVGKMLADAEEDMIKRFPDMEESQIEKSMSYTKKFMSPLWMAIWGFFMNIIVAAIISIITAAIMKKEENPMQTSL